MSRTRCPNCDAIVSVDRPREGAIIECRACGVELEIIRKDPLEVDFTDDWQDDRGDDEE